MFRLVGLLLVVSGVTGLVAGTLGYHTGYREGRRAGYLEALRDRRQAHAREALR